MAGYTKELRYNIQCTISVRQAIITCHINGVRLSQQLSSVPSSDNNCNLFIIFLHGLCLRECVGIERKCLTNNDNGAAAAGAGSGP